MNDIIYSENKIPYTKNKFYDLQIGYYDKSWTDYFKFNLSWNRNFDHAGFNFEISLWIFYFIFYTYDNRHWCMDCEKWKDENCTHEEYEE